MRKKDRTSAVSNLLASKRFIVSVCAAIAMMLGALSAGASTFTPFSSPEIQQSATAPIFTEIQSNGSASKESSGTFTKQKMVEHARLFEPLYTAPVNTGPKQKNIRLELEISKTELGASLFVSPLQTQVNTGAQITLPELINPTPEPTSPPAVEESHPTEPVSPPTENTGTPPPVETQTPPPVQIQTETTSTSTSTDT